MGTIPYGLLGDDAEDHEGYVGHELDDGSYTATHSAETDARKTGQLRAECACGWHADRSWANDAGPNDYRFPSEELEDTIMEAWQAHVREIAGVQPEPDPTAMAHQIAADVRELANAIRPGSVHTVYPAHLYRALNGLRDVLAAMPRFFDNTLETLRRHESAGRLYSDHGGLTADLATLTSELDQARSGLAAIDQPLEAAVDVARNLGYRTDDEEE